MASELIGIIDFIVKWDLYTCAVDGCAFGMKDKDGVPIKKPWQFITSCQRQAVSLSDARCRHAADFKHSIAEGPKTAATERYPPKWTRAGFKALRVELVGAGSMGALECAST